MDGGAENFAVKLVCPVCSAEIDSEATHCPRDGALVDPIKTDTILRQKYRCLGILGHGGMGTIYKVQHVLLNKIVALKMISSAAPGSQAIQRFQNEGKAISALTHEYIVKLYDFGVTSSGHPYIAMDYVRGVTLDEFLKERGVLEERQFVDLFTQICQAIAHAHSHSILHRDMKPSNIMIVGQDTPAPQVRIMDFGIAKFVDDTEGGAAQRLTKTGDAVGSPLYMSPEQINGAKVDQRTDIYSLGCVMYESLAGTVPFMASNAFGTMMMHLNQSPPPLKEVSLGRDTSPALEEVVMRCLEKAPENRFQNMESVREALSGAVSTKSNVSRVSKESVENSSKLSKMAVLIGATLVLLVLVAASGAMFLGRKRPQGKVESPVSTPSTAPVKTAVPLDSNSLKKTLFDQASIESVIESLRVERPSELYMDSTQSFGEPLSDAQLKRAVELNHRLKVLDIRAQPITDHGLECLSQKPLEKLRLGNSAVSDLHALRPLKALNLLGLGDTEVNSKGISVVASLPQLEALNLQGTQIHDSDLMQLTKLKHLKSLNLLRCKNVTAEGIRKFKSVRPNVDVTY